MHDLVGLSPRAFADHLLSLGARRAYAVLGDDGELQLSHPALADLGDFLRGRSPDFHGHEGVFLAVGEESRALFGAFVHDTHRGLSQGGLRFWPYPTLTAFLADGLRLAQGMTRKNALAGLWWGGGKGIIARDPDAPFRDPAYRRTLYREYGAFVTSLAGCYVTAEDAGTGAADMAEVFTATRFVTCIPPALGGSGNPSPAQHRTPVTIDAAAVGFGGRDTAPNPGDQTAAANSLCALGSTYGIDCAVVPGSGRHDWPFASRAFAAALPWLAGQLGTPGVPRAPLPGAVPRSPGETIAAEGHQPPLRRPAAR